jgi:hypothetical protein
MDYQEIKTELMRHFAGEELGQLRKLQNCRQGGKDVSSYNDTFLELAAATGKVAHELQIKDLYIKGLNNPRIRELLGLVLHKPLQQLMTKALDLSYTMYSQPNLKPTRPPTTSHGVTSHHKEFTQKENRRYCTKCNMWFNLTTGLKCGCPERQGQPPRRREGERRDKYAKEV